MRFLEKRSRLTDPYVTAGNRVYVIGTQDGDFPDTGGHIPGEMAGLWDHPIKLADGFFVGLSEGETIVWPVADTFRTYPFYTEHGVNHESYTLVRQQFVPDDEECIVVTIAYTNRTDTEQNLTLIFGIRSDLHPGWLGVEEDGLDLADQHDGFLVFRDSVQPWTLMVGTDATNYVIQIGATLPRETAGQGASAAMNIPITCRPRETVYTRFVLAGSVHGLSSCQETMERMLNGTEDAFARKAKRFEQIEQSCLITVPNPSVQEALPWIKYNTDWLDRKTEMGRGLGAGLPEYPWWFGCDNGYAVQGILCLGWFDMAKDTLRLLASVSETTNGNGRIIHEVSTTGVVFNPGNTQETPQFCMSVWDVFMWTGDIEFLREMYPVVKKAIAWTLSQVPDDKDFPIGYGLIEVENLNDRLIDTAVYTYKALDACAQMAEIFGDSLTGRLLQDRAARLRNDILQAYWLEEAGLFADMRSRPSVMNEKLSLWAERAGSEGLDAARRYYLSLIDESGNDEERPYLLKHWVINTPLETGLAPSDLAIRALQNMRFDFCGPHGVYLSGLEQQRMMTISSGVQAVAECTYGRPDEAIMWIEKVTDSLSLRMPGAITEMSPDYGCFVQAWTVHSVYSPIVRHMFGVTPMAYDHACLLDPDMPSAWAAAELKGLRIGDNRLDVHYERNEGQDVLRIFSAQDYTLLFARPAVEEEKGAKSDTSFVVQAGTELVVRLAPKREPYDNGGALQ